MGRVGGAYGSNRKSRKLYIGAECELQSGKVYPIKTRCTGNKLVVSVRAYKFEYNSLEEFLKRWKVEAVYHG